LRDGSFVNAIHHYRIAAARYYDSVRRLDGLIRVRRENGLEEVRVFGLRFDFPELAVVFVAVIAYLMMESQLLSGIALVLGLALVVMYRN
jgi:hypothetical protein